MLPILTMVVFCVLTADRIKRAVHAVLEFSSVDADYVRKHCPSFDQNV
jgi:hypothetical protein